MSRTVVPFVSLGGELGCMMKSEHSSKAKALLAIWILFVFELIASLAETCEKIDDCSCKKDNGKVISLREIDGGSKGPA